MFPKFQGHDLGMLVQSEIMVQHGQRVMGVVDRVISFLDSKDKIWELLTSLGREHFSKH